MVTNYLYDNDYSNIIGNPNDFAGDQAKAKAQSEYDKWKESTAGHKDPYMVDPTNFLLPEMGDFYLGAVDDVYLRKVEAAMRKKTEDPEEKSKKNDRYAALKAAFYTETPPFNTLGTYQDIYFVRANITMSQDDIDMGLVDGRTVRVALDSIIDNGDGKTVQAIKNKVHSELQQIGFSFDGKIPPSFYLNVLGLNCPKTPQWCKETNVSSSNVQMKRAVVDDIKNSDEYVYALGVHDDSAELLFADICGKWREIDFYKAPDEENKYMSFRWCLHGGSEKTEEGMKAAKVLQRLIGKANGEVYLVLDSSNMYPMGSEMTTIAKSNDVLADLKEWWSDREEASKKTTVSSDDGVYTGFGRYAMSRTKFQGTMYAYIDGTWINLAKAALTEKDGGNFPSTDYDGSHADFFNLQGYDWENIKYADNYVSAVEDLDDRREIQAKIFGCDFDELKEWTVVIGDVTLFVPPSSIRIDSTTTTESLPIVRSKGTFQKTAQKVVRPITLTIFFNEEKGINGYPYKIKHPNGEEETYWMNGLRALISQFRFTPFLPLENDYLNNTLGITAVICSSLNVSSISGYPKLLQVAFTCVEFDFTVYLPEIMYGVENENVSNWFALAFNWEVFRYYVQKPLIAGQKLLANGYEPNSDLYNQWITEHRTCYVPMEFRDPSMRLYIADETYLDDMLQAKLKMLKGENTVDYTKREIQAIEDLGKIFSNVKNGFEDPRFKKALNDLNSVDDLSYNGGFMYFGENPASSKSITGSHLLSSDPNGTSNAEKAMNDAIGVLLNHLNQANVDANRVIYKDPRFKMYSEECDDGTGTNGMRYVFGVTVEFSPNYIESDEEYEDLKKKFATATKLDSESFFVYNRVFIPISAIFAVNRPLSSSELEAETIEDGAVYEKMTERKYVLQGNKFEPFTSHPDMKFLSYCSTYVAPEETTKTKSGATSALSTSSLENLKFQSYTGDIDVESFSVSMANNVTTSFSLQNYSGIAPQYLGGQDIMFNMQVKTTDEETVILLASIQKATSYYARKYHLVLPCSPLKIDSEITRFFGVYEIQLENVEIEADSRSTPVKHINLTFRSVDRTLRMQEAMEKIEAENQDSVSDSNVYETKNIKSHKDIEEQISKSELYPDLELPTLEELKNIGYEFLRYKFQDSRVYVDPDFYFVYPHPISCQIIREACINADKLKDTETKWEDAYGGEVTTKQKKGEGVEVTGYNETAQEQIKSQREIVEAKYTQKAKKLTENLRASPSSIQNESGLVETWNICEDIKTSFLEERYAKELESYIARMKAKNAKEATLADVKEGEDPSTTKDGKISEGRFVYDSLGNAREASLLIDEYLSNNYINETVYSDDELLTRSAVEQMKNVSNVAAVLYTISYNRSLGDVKEIVYSTIEKYLSSGAVQSILFLLNIDLSENFIAVVKDIILGAACAATGEKEYSSKVSSIDWLPNPAFIGVRTGGSQDCLGKTLCDDVNDAIDNAIEFGMFRIRMYSRDEIQSITGEETYYPWSDEDRGKVNTSFYLIDPYYRYNTQEEIETYKRGCITNPIYCTAAFFRLILYWLKRMIDENLIPTISQDTMRSTHILEDQIKTKQEQYGVTPDTALLKHIEFFRKNLYAVDAGKIWGATVLALTDGNQNILDRMKKKDYKGLNGYIQAVTKPSSSVDPKDTVSLMTRKTVLALVGIGRVKDRNAVGVVPTDPAAGYSRDMLEKFYIEAADDPSVYIPHSCHDMIVNDARGRMLRAFPTFFLVFIDEGRQIGSWRLHDNFYNTQAVLDMQIVKSRKIPADTATITMTNFYKSFSTTDEDMFRIYPQELQGKGLISAAENVFNEIFFPEDAYEEAEERREQAPPEQQIRLRAGARISIRMGYGSSAAMLPVVFNGVVAEVNAEDTVTIIAQGDGIELMNPIYDDEEAREVRNKEDLWPWTWRNGETPKNIMSHIMTTAGSFISGMSKNTRSHDWFYNNPYGIYHFGNPEFKDIIKGGEPTQNIFEAQETPAWNTDIDRGTQFEEAPAITFDLSGKTVWDCANICRSVTPDFICSVATFDFRSTLFIGHPRFYYAYSYYIDPAGRIQEKRKPFQQFHIYMSTTDIIRNGIRASQRDMKTAAIGLYQSGMIETTKTQQKVGPLYVDKDIYPENQKTMIVNTQLYGKGLGITDVFCDESGSIIDFETVAWNMTASALKDSVKDMYCGDLVVLGDPSVKPHDRFFIDDTYEGFTGQALVKEVVHTFNVQQGFTTTISPDCINTVKDKYELENQMIYGAIATIIMSAISVASYATSAAILGGMQGIVNRFAKWKNLSWLEEMTAKDASSSAAKKYLSEGLQATKKYGGEAVSKLASGTGKYLTKMMPNLTKTVISTGTRTIATVGARALAGSAIAALAPFSMGALASFAVASALFAIGSCIISETVGELINRYARDLQVLQIYPLKRYGLAYTAGVAGSKGLVYGSPMFNQQGAVQGFFEWLGKEDEDGNDENPIGEFCETLMTSDEMKSAANIARENSGIINSAGLPMKNKNMMKSVIKMPVRGQKELPNDYRMMQVAQQATTPDELERAFSRFAILDTTRLHASPQLRSLSMVSEDSRIKPYISESFFKILHECPELKTGTRVEEQEITLEGKKRTIKVIQYKTTDGTTILDMPLLRRDAINILYEILRRTKNNMPAANSSDPYESYEDSKGSFIVLKSALRAGDTDSVGCTGFTFIIEPHGSAVSAMASAVMNFIDEIEEDAEGKNMYNKVLFNHQQTGDGNEVSFYVRMPAVTHSNEESADDAASNEATILDIDE